VALLILAVGIGMSTAMFTTFQTILIRRLPVADQDRVAIIWPYQVPGAEIAPPISDLTTMARGSRTMSSIAGLAHWQSSTQFFVRGSQTVSLIEAPVSANFFDVLGARPALGRLLRPEDGAASAPAAIVLSHRTWLSQFNGDTAAIGL
jgi:putative ABC transport system permease protein